MDKIPYTCKELINLYALNKVKDYEMLKEFNKIIDYKPCQYSNEKILYAEKNYETQKKRNNDMIEKFFEDSFFKKYNVWDELIGLFGELNDIHQEFYNNDLFGLKCTECNKRSFKFFKYFGNLVCENCGEKIIEKNGNYEQKFKIYTYDKNDYRTLISTNEYFRKKRTGKYNILSIFLR